ncbi:translation elongation factor Ts [Candidatus Woesebacteria bacterium]|nr:translation elongation factor Ts [Candidatus Woesebacteria bacterium]
MSISAADIKALRDLTGAAVMDCKNALTEANGDMKKAEELVKLRGLAKAEKKADRETKEGYIASYVHATGKIAALVEIQCETDFVARNPEFQTMAKEVAMQVTAMNPETVEELLAQEYLRDASITIEQLVKQLSGKIGEKFVVSKFIRYAVGE